MIDSGFSRCGLAALLLAATLGKASAGDLTAREIEAELVGRQILWWQTDGWQSGFLTLTPGGVADITVDGPGSGRDEGTWQLRNDALCTRWRAMRAAEEKCYRLTRSATGRFVTSDGNVFEIREAGA